VLDTLPATVPVALALGIWELARRRVRATTGPGRPAAEAAR